MSSLRNSTMGSIQLGPTLNWWARTTFPVTFVGLHKSSIRITQGKLCVEEIASMARESACVFPLLRMWSRLNDSNFDYKCLTWLKYPCILSSLASSSPPLSQRPVLSPRTFLLLFLPLFEPWTFPPTKPHIQSHCLWLRSPILMISQWWASQVRSKLTPHQIPLGLLLH